MFLPNQTGIQSYHYSIFQAFKNIGSIIRYLPACIGDWLFILLRLFFLSLLGFAAWVRSFSDTGFATWFIIALVLGFVVHAYFARPCFFPDEKCKSKDIDQNVNEWLKNEVTSQKTVCDTLEHVRAALESKTRIEMEAENATEHWKKQLNLSEQVAHGLRLQLNELSKTKTRLENELRRKIDENEALSGNYRKNLDQLNDTVKSVKEIEFNKSHLEQILSSEHDSLKALEDENTMLKATIEVMKKQRKTLSAKHASAMKEVRNLSDEKEALLATKYNANHSDILRIEDLKKLTQRLQSSISNAKGKLSKVEDVLSDGERTRPTTPIRALTSRTRK